MCRLCHAQTPWRLPLALRTINRAPQLGPDSVFCCQSQELGSEQRVAASKRVGKETRGGSSGLCPT